MKFIESLFQVKTSSITASIKIEEVNMIEKVFMTLGADRFQLQYVEIETNKFEGDSRFRLMWVHVSPFQHQQKTRLALWLFWDSQDVADTITIQQILDGLSVGNSVIHLSLSMIGETQEVKPGKFVWQDLRVNENAIQFMNKIYNILISKTFDVTDLSPQDIQDYFQYDINQYLQNIKKKFQVWDKKHYVTLLLGEYQYTMQSSHNGEWNYNNNYSWYKAPLHEAGFFQLDGLNKEFKNLSKLEQDQCLSLLKKEMFPRNKLIRQYTSPFDFGNHVITVLNSIVGAFIQNSNILS